MMRICHIEVGKIMQKQEIEVIFIENTDLQWQVKLEKNSQELKQYILNKYEKLKTDINNRQV